MQIKCFTERMVSESDLEEFLRNFHRVSVLKTISSLLSMSYSNNYSNYVNVIQVIPGVLNSVVLFCKGENTNFDFDDFNKLVVMISAYDPHPSDSDAHGIEQFYPSYLRLVRHCEYGSYVKGRLNWIFREIDRRENFSFESVTSLRLEHLLLPLWTAFALGGKGAYYPSLNSNTFQTSSLSESERANLIEFLNDNISCTLLEAEGESVDTSSSLQVNTTAFETRPFLKVDDEYFLMAPHFVLNELVTIFAKFYISSYSDSDNNEASSYYGNVYEKYIQKLLLKLMPEGELEPAYGNDSNAKGVDFVFLKKNSVPLFVEIQKGVFFRSMFSNFSLREYEKFLNARVINKYRQIFKWLKSHNLLYKDIDLRQYISSFRLVLCLSTTVPLLNFPEFSNLLLNLINNAWKEIFGIENQFSLLNIYLVSSYDIEMMTSIATAKKITFAAILLQYRIYYFNHSHIYRSSSGIEIREGFTEWLQNKYNNVCYLNQDLCDESDSLFSRMKSICFAGR